MARAQTKPDRITRYLAAKALVQAITAADLQAAAARYLPPDRAIELLVVPAPDKGEPKKAEDYAIARLQAAPASP